jgi:hypothetical protein
LLGLSNAPMRVMLGSNSVTSSSRLLKFAF